MQESEIGRQKEEPERREIRRRKRQVDNRGQLILFSSGEGSEVKYREVRPGMEAVREYEDPSPGGILIGGEDLRSFLESRGESGAIQIRELVRGLELKGFHKKPPKAGRRPYHPAGMLGLILFGILEGRNSLRQLETMARTDVRSWWISGGIQPDHSVIGRFIQQHEEQLSEEFFIELTQQVLQLTGGRGGDLAGDGTIIQAAGSRYRRLSKEAAEIAEQEAQEAHREAPQDEKLRRRAEQAQAVAEAARQRVEVQRRGRHRGKIEVSVSEPEAVVQPLKNRAGMAASYKPVVLSNQQQIVVAQTVHPSCEHAQYSQLLDQAEHASGQVTQVRLDSGYFNFEVIEESQARDIELLCAEGEGSRSGRKRKKAGKFSKSEFRYHPKGDYYECPAGERLVAVGKRGQDRGRGYRRYGRAPCSECAQRSQCTDNPKGRLVKRYINEELKDQLRAKMQQPGIQQEYQKRRHMVEPVFARIKVHQGLWRFKRKGLRSVRVEFALHAAVHNIARLLALRRASKTLFYAFQDLFRRFMGGSRSFLGLWIPSLSPNSQNL